MVRLADLPEWEREHLLEKGREAPRFTERHWVTGKPLKERRVAIVTTSGIHRRTDRPFDFVPGTEYRVIPGDTASGELVMSHASVNFDRSGFLDDINVFSQSIASGNWSRPVRWDPWPTFTTHSWEPPGHPLDSRNGRWS